MTIKISILHPSRQRPNLAKAIFLEWLKCCDNPNQIEYLIGMDDDDSSIDEYKQLFQCEEIKQFGRFEICIEKTRDIPASINSLCRNVSPTSELFVAIADDMGSMFGWDSMILKSLSTVNNFKDPKFIGVSDGYRPYGVALFYMIINRALYEKFGYGLYPEYNGTYADTDLFEVVKRLNCIVDMPNILFKHRHYTTGLTPCDATYMRHNSPESNYRNMQIYFNRQSRNFDL